MKALLTVAALTLAFVTGACSRSEEVEFAVILPLSGDWAVYGDPIRKGIDLAMDDIRLRKNPPYRVSIQVSDSQSNPERAAQLLETLYREGALAALGGVTSQEALAMIPVADHEEKILLSPSASSPELSGASRYFFRVFPSDFREGTKMGNFAAQSLKLDNVVILAADSTYAHGITEVFQAEFERNDGRVLATLVYPEGTENLGDILEQALAQKPQALYVADFAEPVRKIFAELQARGFQGTLMTTSAFNAPDVISAAGDAVEGVILTQTAFDPDSEDPEVQHFVEAYRKKYGETPGTFAAHGYDAMRVLADAGQSMSLKAASEMLKGIRSLGNEYHGVTGALQFDERGDVGQFPRVYIFQNGELEDYQQAVDESREVIRKRLEEIRRQQKRRLRQGGVDN